MMMLQERGDIIYNIIDCNPAIILLAVFCEFVPGYFPDGGGSFFIWLMTLRWACLSLNIALFSFTIRNVATSPPFALVRFCHIILMNRVRFRLGLNPTESSLQKEKAICKVNCYRMTAFLFYRMVALIAYTQLGDLLLRACVALLKVKNTTKNSSKLKKRGIPL
jgi:hypothetical protein